MVHSEEMYYFKIVFLLCISYFSFIQCEECTYTTSEVVNKIRLGFISMRDCGGDDVFHSLSSTKELSEIFTFVCINGAKENIHDLICKFENDVDIVINNLYPYDAYDIFKNRNNLDILNIMIPKNNISLLTEWDDKKLFKLWMIKHGFKDYVPYMIDPNNLTFPLIMKGTVSSGTSHVFIIHNLEQYNAKKLHLINEKKDMLLEEALTGMGMMEGDVFGAVFEGDMVSMKCQINPFFGNGHSYTKSPTSEIYLRNGNQYPKYEWASCGSKLVSIVSEIMSIAKFTGAFGISFKMNTEKHIKFFDMNARINGDHVQHSDFFIMHYVPLAFKMRKYYETVPRIRDAHPRHPLLSSSCNSKGWYYRQDLLAIVQREYDILKNGFDKEHPKSILEVVNELMTHQST